MSRQPVRQNRPQHHIRPYDQRDREVVWRLAADTAFFGDPVEAFLDDRDLFCEAFVAYYTDQEPEHLWVAEMNGDVVGYVTGCADNRRREWFSRTCTLPQLLGKVLAGQYRIGRKTLQFCWRGAWAWGQRAIPRVPLARFPAHLHVNVAALARGQGIGRALLEACLAHLWAEGASGVHLHTTDRNRAACRLYESIGFRLQGVRPTRLWCGLANDLVENRVYGIVPAWQVSLSQPDPEGADI